LRPKRWLPFINNLFAELASNLRAALMRGYSIIKKAIAVCQLGTAEDRLALNLTEQSPLAHNINS